MKRSVKYAAVAFIALLVTLVFGYVTGPIVAQRYHGGFVGFGISKLHGPSMCWGVPIPWTDVCIGYNITFWE